MNPDRLPVYPDVNQTDEPEIVIRHLVKADLPALEWDGEYSHFRRLYARAYQRSQKKRAVLWVAEMVEVGVIGQLFVQLAGERAELADGEHRAYIYSFRVQPPYRRFGVGTRLLQTAEQDLFERGMRTVTLNVGRENHEARQLYERLGYRVVAPEPGRWRYIDDRGRVRTVHEPAWRMEKLLM